MNPVRFKTKTEVTNPLAQVKAAYVRPETYIQHSKNNPESQLVAR